LYLLDFANEYQQDPERALARFQLLLLDPDACSSREDFLRALAATADGAMPPAHDHGPAITLVCEEGVFAAHKNGSLTPERVEQLARLTRDPEALLKAHHKLLDWPPPPVEPVRPPDETRFQQGTRVESPSSQARAGQGERVVESLRPLLPFLLRHVGLGEEQAEAFLDFVREHLGEVREQGRRFRELLPGWLEEFARGRQPQSRPLREQDLGPLVERAAVATVLSRGEDDEPGWARELRALASSVQTREELLRLELPERLSQEPAAESYLFGLAREIKHCHEELVRELELT
jgi:hypothetical protein